MKGYDEDDEDALRYYAEAEAQQDITIPGSVRTDHPSPPAEPSPEMLEKAEAVIAGWKTKSTIDLRWRIALALQSEASETRKEMVTCPKCGEHAGMFCNPCFRSESSARASVEIETIHEMALELNKMDACWSISHRFMERAYQAEKAARASERKDVDELLQMSARELDRALAARAIAEEERDEAVLDAKLQESLARRACADALEITRQREEHLQMRDANRFRYETEFAENARLRAESSALAQKAQDWEAVADTHLLTIKRLEAVMTPEQLQVVNSALPFAPATPMERLKEAHAREVEFMEAPTAPETPSEEKEPKK